MLIQVLQFLEYLYDSMLKLNKSDEDKKMADIIGTEITKWIELLVNNIDMFADDAIQYLKELQSHSRFDRTYQRIITASVSIINVELVVQKPSMFAYFT